MKRIVETTLPKGEILEIKKLADDTYKVVQLFEEAGEDFILIEAEKLSLRNKFMHYIPETDEEKETKKLIEEAITKKVKNFYRPKCDPSLADDGTSICFVGGTKPVIGKNCQWWDERAKKYDPERNSRLGTRLEYGAFLGVLIKQLVKEGRSIKWAWNAVCNDSHELGHYRDSVDAKFDFEATGSRPVCGFYDLANTYKILANDDGKEGYCFAGGGHEHYGKWFPLAAIFSTNFRTSDKNNGVGWIVLS